MPEIVLIEWIDSRAVVAEWVAWTDIEETMLSRIWSVGFIAHEDESRIVLVCGWDMHMENASGGMMIPLSAIRSRKTLNVPD